MGGDKVPSLFDPWVEWFEEWIASQKQTLNTNRDHSAGVSRLAPLWEVLFGRRRLVWLDRGLLMTEEAQTLWEGRPVTITVNPAGMTLHAYDDEKVQKLRDDYKDVKILSATHLKKEWERRWNDAQIVEIEDFSGSVEILEWGGDVLASFSGSDEYSGQVHSVWKITVRAQKKGYPDKTWQLWTSYRG